MPANFTKITIKWLLVIFAINFLTRQLINLIVPEIGFGSASDFKYFLLAFSTQIISILGFLIPIGLGVRDLSRSNQHNISVGSVFGFFAILIIIPMIINHIILYYQTLSNEEMADVYNAQSFRISLIIGLILNFIYSIIALTYISLWRIFRRAGKTGWHALVPIYNLVVMCDIAQKSRSLVILFFIPIINIVAYFLLVNAIARSFDRSTEFSIGLFFLPFIFFPILAFGTSKYVYGEYEVVPEEMDIEDHLVD